MTVMKTKSKSHRRRLKFENFKHCLKATQLENKISYTEKNKNDMDSIKKNHKECIKIFLVIIKNTAKV